MKKTIKEFIKEIVPVVVGILIALWINDWNDDRKDRAYIDQIFKSIQKELRETDEDIVAKIALQQTLVDTLNHYLNDSTVSLGEIVSKSTGIYMPGIRISSWKALSNTRIELVDYDKLSALATIEETKEVLKMQAEKMVDILFLNAEDTGAEKKELMKISMLSIMGNEKSLQEDIQKVIKNPPHQSR